MSIYFLHVSKYRLCKYILVLYDLDMSLVYMIPLSDYVSGDIIA